MAWQRWGADASSTVLRGLTDSRTTASPAAARRLPPNAQNGLEQTTDGDHARLSSSYRRDDSWEGHAYSSCSFQAFWRDGMEGKPTLNTQDLGGR